MDKPQVFWDAYRVRWEAKLEQWNDRCRREGWPHNSNQRNLAWSEWIIQAAEAACQDYADLLQRKVSVGRHTNCPIDVFAIEKNPQNTNVYEYVVAFESEQKSHPGKGSWHKEFKDLCGTSAEIRVLASVFKVREGPSFRAKLEKWVESMRSHCKGPQGDFLLIFGPEWISDEFPWLIYSLERDFKLRPLTSAEPFIPRRVINRNKPREV